MERPIHSGRAGPCQYVTPTCWANGSPPSRQGQLGLAACRVAEGPGEPAGGRDTATGAECARHAAGVYFAPPPLPRGSVKVLRKRREVKQLCAC